MKDQWQVKVSPCMKFQGRRRKRKKPHEVRGVEDQSVRIQRMLICKQLILLEN